MTKRTAYLSMEIGIGDHIPTYSGGLGVLAGDTLKSFADLGKPVCAVTLLYRQGYFAQAIENGTQKESPQVWDPSEQLEKTSHSFQLSIAGRKAYVDVWQYHLKGLEGHVPIYFLDVGNENTDPELRSLTDHLYGGDDTYRIRQECLLGFGALELLNALPEQATTLHLNEGHAAFSCLGLYKQLRSWEQVRERVVFTTHTPVEAGHDQFDLELVKDSLSSEDLEILDGAKLLGSKLNMTHLAIHGSRFVNGVAKRHRDISRKMFAGTKIDGITNGVHHLTWVTQPSAKVFDEHCEGWRENPLRLRFAADMPLEAVSSLRRENKANLFKKISQETGINLDPAVLTLGFARRAATYKRADFLFENVNALKAISQHNPLQVVMAGKAHPKDEGGKTLIQKLHSIRDQLGSSVQLVYVPGYNMDWGRLITAGVDIWLNTPIKPMEASGTSGMKSAMNGVPSFSTLDGWWVEGCIEGGTGWEIEDQCDGFAIDQSLVEKRQQAQNRALQKLELIIAPMFYRQREEFLKIQRQCIAYNGSYFNTHRMVGEYLQNYR